MQSFHVGCKAVIKTERGVLLVQKTKKETQFYEFPGGRINTDEDFEQTLQRELLEELPGISSVKIGRLLSAQRLFVNVTENDQLVLLYFLVEATLPEIIRLSDEHTGHLFITTPSELPEQTDVFVKQLVTEALT
jgi:8-oxo-dGTP pyrophosphatase MutT (NUDIX family)